MLASIPGATSAPADPDPPSPWSCNAATAAPNPARPANSPLTIHVECHREARYAAAPGARANAPPSSRRRDGKRRLAVGAQPGDDARIDLVRGLAPEDQVRVPVVGGQPRLASRHPELLLACPQLVAAAHRGRRREQVERSGDE